MTFAVNDVLAVAEKEKILKGKKNFRAGSPTS